MLVLELQRGRLFSGEGVGRSDVLRPAGVGVAETFGFAGDGAVTVGLGIADFLPAVVVVVVVVVVAGWGMPENRRVLDMVVRAVLPTELPRRLDVPIGVLDPLAALPERTTDEAGELPGVSATLLVAGLSNVTMLEMESRKCWGLVKLMSSSDSSMTLMLAFSASVLDFMSDNNLKVSPLTVSRSLTPFWTMVHTRSIAGT